MYWQPRGPTGLIYFSVEPGLVRQALTGIFLLFMTMVFEPTCAFLSPVATKLWKGDTVLPSVRLSVRQSVRLYALNNFGSSGWNLTLHAGTLAL